MQADPGCSPSSTTCFSEARTEPCPLVWHPSPVLFAPFPGLKEVWDSLVPAALVICKLGLGVPGKVGVQASAES